VKIYHVVVVPETGVEHVAVPVLDLADADEYVTTAQVGAAVGVKGLAGLTTTIATPVSLSAGVVPFAQSKSHMSYPVAFAAPIETLRLPLH